MFYHTLPEVIVNNVSLCVKSVMCVRVVERMCVPGDCGTCGFPASHYRYTSTGDTPSTTRSLVPRVAPLCDGLAGEVVHLVAVRLRRLAIGLVGVRLGLGFGVRVRG